MALSLLIAKTAVIGAGVVGLAVARRLAQLGHQRNPGRALGVYFSYSGQHSFRQLVYPLPEPGGLG
jgi:L-2-hydroxyglutarate oxidase LhgO